MTVAHDPHDERLRQWFGHDRVALFGAGGMPAAPPAPPGSPARRQGEAALADALSKVGKPGPRVGERPAAPKPKPSLASALRVRGERALMEADEREAALRAGRTPPAPTTGLFWRAVFVPFYRAIPWPVKRTMTVTASGVKGWYTGKPSPLQRVSEPLAKVAAPAARVAAPLKEKLPAVKERAGALAPSGRPGKKGMLAGAAGLAVVAALLHRLLRRR